MLNIISHWKTQDETSVRYRFTPIPDGYDQKMDNNNYWLRIWRNQNPPITLLMGMENSATALENRQFLKNVKHQGISWLPPLLGIFPRE